MSIMLCYKHDRFWDSDHLEECPDCAREDEMDWEEFKDWTISVFYVIWLTCLIFLLVSLGIALSGCATTREPYNVEEEAEAWTQECYYEGDAFREVPPEDCRDQAQAELARQPAFTAGLSQYERRVRTYDVRQRAPGMLD